MILSPCANCPKKDQPKDICSKHCKILQEVQRYHFSSRELNIQSAIDYAAENRYAIVLNRTELHAAF